jgi:ankyrin repeat protein
MEMIYKQNFVNTRKENRYFLNNVCLIPKDFENPNQKALFSSQIKADAFLDIMNDKKFDINETDSNKWGYLHYAAARNNSEIIDVLLKKGANIEEKNIDGKTPLYIAIMFESLDAIKILLENGANKNVYDNIGHHLLYSAELRKNEEINKLLNLEEEKKSINIYENSYITKLIEKAKLVPSKYETFLNSVIVNKR